MQFSEIIGQEEVKNRLRQSVLQGRMPHAQLFCGVEGVGKLALAVAYAQYACCTNRTETDSCGTCPSCIKFAKMAHPDLHLVFPFAKNESKKLTLCDHFVNEFREAVVANPYLTLNQWMTRVAAGKQGMIYASEGDEIIRKLNLKTFESDYKVMIIWHPEKMHESCANHLLKIIEEPPAQTLFLLISDQPEEIIGTIRSRVQRVPVPPLTVDDLQQAATQKLNLDAQQISLWSRMAQGSWSKLIGLVEQNDEQTQNYAWFVQLMRAAWALNVKEIMRWSAELKAAGREATKNFLQYAQRMIRENFIQHLQQPELNYMTSDEAMFAGKFAQFINERNVELIMAELQLAEAQIEQNCNGDIVMCDLGSKLYRLLKK